MFDWFKPRKPISLLSNVIAEIEQYKLYATINPYSSDKSLVKLITLFGTLYEYRLALVSYIDYLTQDTLVPRYRIPATMLQIYLRDFFTHDKKFIDVVEELSIFLEVCQQYLTLYEEKENLLDKSFNTEKNLLLLQTVTNNVITITRGIRDAT